MAERDYEVGVRLKGDGSGLVGETRAGIEAMRELESQAKRTSDAIGESARAQGGMRIEAGALKQILDVERDAMSAVTRETGAMTSGALAATAAVAGLRGVISGMLSAIGGPLGLIALLSTAALGWSSFGSAANEAATQAEDAARRARAAAQTLPDPYAQTRENLGALIAGHGMQITSLEARRDAANAPEYRARIQARIDALREEQRLVADALQHYPPAPADEGGGRRDRALERELDRLRQLQAKSSEEDLRAQHAQIEANDVLIRQAVERARLERERLETLGENSWEQDLFAQESAMQQRDDLMRRSALQERAERERSENELAEQREKALARAAAEQQRMTENLERSLTDATVRGLIEGFRRGEDAFENFLNRMEEAFLAAVFTPIIQPIMAPIAGMMAGVGQGIASSIWGNAAGGGMGQILNAGGIAGMGSLFGGASMASVNTSAAAIMGGGLEAGTAAAAGLGGGITLAGALPWIGAGLLAASALGVFDGDGDAMRTAPFRMGFGDGSGWPYEGDRWFSGDMAPALTAFAQAQAGAEQNLIRNLNLDPAQIASVNAALAGPNSRTYGFGIEHTDVAQSGAFQQIAAERLQAISRALGRSIEELTRVMSLSAEQWQQMIDQAAVWVRRLPDLLGITGLERFGASLAVSDFRAPLERLAGARGAYEETYARALTGDPDAVHAFPGVAQQLLGIGRDVYASGPEFQALDVQVRSALGELESRQGALLDDLTRELPAAVMQASVDNLAAIKAQTAEIVSHIGILTREVRNLQPSV